LNYPTSVSVTMYIPEASCFNY